MDRVHALPPGEGKYMRDNFYPAVAQAVVPYPTICRLYFGKTLAAPDGRRV
jgi:hypothetical protein